jgi:DNA-binding beta-propeller fold protein YncE
MQMIKHLFLAALTATLITLSPISFPGGESGIGFDDLGLAPSLHRVLVPGGRSGKLMLIDPETQKTEMISGFTQGTEFGGGHGEGITSADEGPGAIFVTDRSSKCLNVVDGQSRKIVATTPLGAGPDYVRFVAETNEVWVTEPRAQGIEVFSMPAGGTPRPVHSGFIEVPGGPESLVIGHSQKRAYVNLWSDSSVVIDLKSRKLMSHWPNGCKGSRGLALDAEHGFLFVGCEEGKVSILGTADGKQLGEASSGAGVDIIAYNGELAHLYLPGGQSATMATIGISTDGKASVLGTVSTASDAHCVTSDGRNQVYVCDPGHGRILVFKDSLPASR